MQTGMHAGGNISLLCRVQANAIVDRGASGSLHDRLFTLRWTFWKGRGGLCDLGWALFILFYFFSGCTGTSAAGGGARQAEEKGFMSQKMSSGKYHHLLWLSAQIFHRRLMGALHLIWALLKLSAAMSEEEELGTSRTRALVDREGMWDKFRCCYPHHVLGEGMKDAASSLSSLHCRNCLSEGSDGLLFSEVFFLLRRKGGFFDGEMIALFCSC